MRCSTLRRSILLPCDGHAAARHAIHGAIKASDLAAFKTFDSPFLNDVDY
jgi:hypothetical protein